MRISILLPFLVAMAGIQFGCASYPVYDPESVETRKNDKGDRLSYAKGEKEPLTGIVVSYWNSGKKEREALVKKGLPVWAKAYAKDGSLFQHEKYHPNGEMKESTRWWLDDPIGGAGPAGHLTYIKRWDEEGNLIFHKQWPNPGEQEELEGWNLDGTRKIKN